MKEEKENNVSKVPIITLEEWEERKKYYSFLAHLKNW